MPWIRPTLTELVSRIETDLASRLLTETQPLKRSVIAVLARVMAGAVHLLHGFHEWMSRQPLADTAELEYLERLCRIWGVSRKAAAFAAGTVTFTGVSGSIVPAEAELQLADGTLYTLDADATLAAGTATAAVTASEAGASGNLAAGQTLSLVSPVSGVTSAATVHADAITGGLDQEADASLRARLVTRIQQPPHGGAIHDYVAWAKEVSGVTRAWCYPLHLGLGTVGLTFVLDGEADPIPDSAKVAEVQAYVDALRPVTADLTVFAPTPVDIDLDIQLTPDSTAVREAVELELNDFLERVAEPGATLYLSQINEAISVAAGETDHVLVSPAANVALTTGQFPLLGTITWGGA